MLMSVSTSESVHDKELVLMSVPVSGSLQDKGTIELVLMSVPTYESLQDKGTIELDVSIHV